ncbi:hypothetical protein [Staphylospora marina]|uniref:hypothetical protein n=1 Tax=Staphylospora marina TaxID=2490858 RepID=UPI000F5C0E3F|nr:hypothetical protein [Staphylospora marina]
MEMKQGTQATVEAGHPFPSDPGKHSRWIGFAVVFFVFVMSVGLAAVYHISRMDATLLNKWTESSGIRMENELDREAVAFLERRKLLEPGERLITYYDRWSNRSRVSILTDRRLIWWVEDRMLELPLSSVTEVKRYKRENRDGEIDVFVLVARDGRRMKVEMEEGHGADVFERELNDAIHAKESGH